MRSRRLVRGESEIFGMSFLDVVSCALGAVLAMVLIAKEKIVDKPEVPVVTTIEAPAPVVTNPARLSELETELAALRVKRSKLSSRLQDEKVKTAEAMVAAIERQTAASATKASSGTMQSQYAAGIPVGRHNLIFIIDTSGSMQAQWPMVIQTLEKVIGNHPKVSGLQVLSDNGDYLIPGYKGRWIPDTGTSRKRALDALKSWSAFSNSSPAEGLEVALRTYAKPDSSLSIYVFGDDFTGSSFEQVRRVVDRWNVDRTTKKRIADIHAVGFPGGIGDRFGTLMRHIANENNGVFIGLQ
jgi:hypothetical protein